MRPGFVPSYLFLSRHGIYYFRCRIPLSTAKKYNFPRTEIRKSLHTSNRVDAIKKARRMWLEHIDVQDHIKGETAMDAIGKPADKYSLILYLPEAIRKIREYYGESGDNTVIPRISHYLSKLGDDPDVLSAFMKSLTKDEKSALAGYEPFKRTMLIINLNHQQHIAAKQQHQSKDNSLDKVVSIDTDRAVAKFMENFKTQYERNKKTKMPPTSYEETERPLTVFSAILGNPKTGLISKETIETYINRSYEFPARLNTMPGFTGMKVKDIINQHYDKLIKTDFSEYGKKSNGALKKEFGNVKIFLKWLEIQGYTNRKLYDFIPSVSKDKPDNSEKSMLTDDDYQLFFNSDLYTTGKHIKPSNYWIPLIGIFSGCRVEEIASLFKENIKKDIATGIWVFEIMADASIEKRRKTFAAIRIIPIHNKLIELGLLEYVNSLPEKSQIFPELKPNNGRFSKKWDDDFNKHQFLKKNGKILINKDGSQKMVKGLLTRCGIDKKITNDDGSTSSKSFHSLRHYFINEIDKMDGSDRVKNMIVGHKYKGARVGNYIHPDKDDLLAGNTLINNITYPSIDFSKIRKYQHRTHK